MAANNNDNLNPSGFSDADEDAILDMYEANGGDFGDCYDDSPNDDWEDDDDGQPSMYEEYQDLYGGDDWDHGQYDGY